MTSSRARNHRVDVPLTGSDAADDVGRGDVIRCRMRDPDGVVEDIQTDEKRSSLVHG